MQFSQKAKYFDLFVATKILLSEFLQMKRLEKVAKTMEFIAL